MVPARVVRPRRHPPFLLFFCFFAFLSLFPNRATAFADPQRYYDWGPYYPATRPAVLGISTPEGTSSAAGKAPQINRFRGYFFGFGANFSPDNPFYFLKKFQESVALGLSFDPQRREEVRLNIAGERLAEMENLIEEGKVEGLWRASEDYHRLLEAIAENLVQLRERRPADRLGLDTFEEEANKHTLVLETAAFKVPEAAREALELALTASTKVIDRVADLSDRPTLPLEVRERLQALKAQGLLSPEEVQRLISVETRVRAREELKKYAAEGIFPEAEVAKLNEWAERKFAEDHQRMTELKKLSELKRIEEEKPDAETLKKVQAFAKTYQPGELIPPDLRRYWVPLVRLEELQNTLRPDLIDPKVLEAKKELAEKFTEVVEEMRPRREDLEQYEKMLIQNPDLERDPFYGRLKKLAEKFGTTEQTPAPVGKTCPGNAHWANIPFMPEGGYCVPNITYPPVVEESEGGKAATICPEKYHRNYPSGPCLPDNYFGPATSQPTYTPGGYPSPIYPPVRCPEGYFWSGTTCLAKEGREKGCLPPPPCLFRKEEPRCLMPEPPGGWCREEKDEKMEDCFRAGRHWYDDACHDKPKTDWLEDKEKKPEIEACFRSGKYWYDDQCHDRPRATKDRFEERKTEMEACFKSGRFWDNDRCQDQPESGGRGGGEVKSCPAGQFLGPGGYCLEMKMPPMGYGQCPAGQFWNGAACVSPGPIVPPAPLPSPSPAPAPEPGHFSEPTSAPAPSPESTSGTPPSGGGYSGGSSCPTGYYFKDGACVKGEY